MSYLQHVHLIPAFMVIMGLTSGATVAQTIAQPLTGAGDSSGQPAVTLSDKNDDPADGFTGSGSPNRRSSGGSRGDCSELLVALVPGDEALAVSETGCSLPSSSEPALTTSAMPVLWFHVPAQSEMIEGEFALLDDTQLALSVQTIPLPPEGGIVGIQIGAELAVDSTYNWVFSMLAHPRKPADNPRVAGTVQRVAPSPEVLTEINATENLQQQAEIWLNQGVWHNALTAAATLKQSDANQTAGQQWQEFLGSAGLEAIADAPIQDCCH